MNHSFHHLPKISFLRILSFSFLFTISMPMVFAQKIFQQSSAEILHSIKKLNVLGSVLYVAAHPDDENTRLLAYMAKDRQYRTGYMAMTRGDGGQNLIGDEQGFDLGLIRTQELLAARRVDGAEQFFTRAYDFGFSKSTEEALAFWDKEKVLADAVWVIRNFRPDVIITRFPEDARAGHGHHSASAVIAREAFIAAADPLRYPEQFKYGVEPWQAKRILWNTFSFGSSNTTSENQMKIDVGTYISLLGKSIGEISAEGRSQHRSQGFGSASSRGSAIEYFTPVMGEKASVDPMEKIDCSWSRVKGGDSIKEMIDKTIGSFNFENPSSSLIQLVAIRKAIASLEDAYWKKNKLSELDKLIQMCAGLHLDAIADRQHVKQGDTLKLSFSANNRSGIDIGIVSVEVDGVMGSASGQLKKNINWFQSFSIPVALDKNISQPYWLVNEMSQGYFNVSDQQLIGMAENKPSYHAKVLINFYGELIGYEVPVRFRVVDPAKGEFFHPVYVVPSVIATKEPSPIFINTRDAISMKNGLQKSGTQVLGQQEVSNVIHTIDYEHIPSITYISKSKPKIIDIDLMTSGKKIGYVVGAGDKVPAALEQMGYQVILLNQNDIVSGKLDQYDAVVMGVRAYNIHGWLEQKYDILMDYVKNGGNMIVQYNTNSNAGPFRNKIGPKPFTISRNRVTEEDAEVVILDEKDPILNFPNKITNADFRGWIQERGIYFADTFGSDYKPILSMHDKGEASMNGSVVVRNEGKGRFIYTGLVFFRELPAGVSGAFRLFANFVSNTNKKINEPK